MPQLDDGIDRYHYECHRPEETPLYDIVRTHYPRFLAQLEADGGSLPAFVKQEFDDYLKCGLLEHGFLRVKCDACNHEHLVAFSCKRRGFCPSCGARRMVESAAHLVDHVLPEQPIRQWVLTFPFPLRFLFAAQPQVLSQVLGVVYRAISTFLIKKTGFTVASGAKTGDGDPDPALRFGADLNTYPARSTFTCSSSTASIPLTDNRRSNEHRGQPRPSSLSCYIPSATESPVCSSARAYSCAIPSTIIST